MNTLKTITSLTCYFLTNHFTKTMKAKFSLIFVLLFLFLIGITPSFAQKGFNAGVNLGYNASAMFDKIKFGEVPYNLKLKTGPAFGIALGYNFTDKFGLEIEGNYLYIGSAFSIPKDNLQFQKKYDLTYYQIPVMLKFTGGDFPGRFSSMIGPVFGFLNTARMSSDSGSNGDVKGSFKPSDLGLLVSAGGDVTLSGNLYMNIALRVYYGFNTINIDPKFIMNSPNENDQLNNVYIGLNLGLYNMFVKAKPDKAPDW